MRATLKRRRWPKGTWMKLKSKDILRAFLESGGVSHRDLARFVECHQSFIGHLTAGRRKTCTPKTATRIAQFLNVPLEVLFDVEVPTGKQSIVKGQAA